jgi:hypothetical protein
MGLVMVLRHLAAGVLGVGCGASGGENPGTPAPPVVPLPPQNIPSSIGLGTESCQTTTTGANLRLERIPEFVTAFHHPFTSCYSLRAGHLLRNNGDKVLRVEGISVSAGLFNVESVELPHDLIPGHSMSIRVGYVGESDEGETGRCVVRTSEGCVEFSLMGLAAYDVLVNRSEDAVDFGDIKAGEEPQFRDVELLVQGLAGGPSVQFLWFSTFGGFELVDGPTTSLVPASCEPIRLRVKATTSGGPGPSNGSLLWETQIGRYFGIAEVPLFARVVE